MCSVEALVSSAPERSLYHFLVILLGGTSHSPSPGPYLALWAQVRAASKPSWRQATVASWRAKLSSHTVPHWPWYNTSRRPSSGLLPGPTSRIFVLPSDCGLLRGAWPSSRRSRSRERVAGGNHIMMTSRAAEAEAPGE